MAAAAPESRLNLLLTDGTGIWATAWYHSLSVRTDELGALVASEPLDPDPGWRPVPDRHLVTAAPGYHRCVPLATTPAPVAAPTIQGIR